jgi:hypothetical protein
MERNLYMLKEWKKMEEGKKRNGFGRKKEQKRNIREIRRRKRYRIKGMSGGFIMPLMTGAELPKTTFVH